VHHFIPTLGKHWIWRCHIDTSEPNPNAWEFLRPFVEEYDAGVFTMRQFVPRDLHLPAIGIIRPAIDPLSPKNMAIPEGLAQGIMEWAGVRTDRPVMTQVSRFDPWKDPLGVVEVFRRVRSEVPDLQLALLGSMALDDPEGWDMYRTVLEETEGEPEIHVLTNLTGISDVEVNAFQTLSDVVVQKSIREGFGLVVSEAAWKGTPVVAGRAGGIPLQIPPANQDLLVDDGPSCVERILALLRDPGRARVRGAVGRKWTRTQFLLPRLAADDLQLMRRLLGLTDSLEGAPPEEA
jgi:trehalose synthase